MADEVALDKQAMRPGTHGHLLCSALLFCQWYKMPLKAMKKKSSGNDVSQHIVNKVGTGNKEAVSQAAGVLLHCTKEVRNVMTIILSHQNHQVCVREQTVHI